MEYKRNNAIPLYLAGNLQVAIVRALQNLNVNKSFVSRTIARHKATGSIAKRYGVGRKKSATSSEMVRKVKKRIERNPRRSGRKMATELYISARNVQKILQSEVPKSTRSYTATEISKSGTSQGIASSDQKW
ncbi:unnamed protein product [Hermetia illucens]|uniref:Uncharacterized protein n=1 Tax=Hermetia illucens TaxID=343691 RepID=A0A7R8UZ67_HERIL|nr:unnamed protein product [Hermetia illucens]